MLISEPFTISKPKRERVYAYVSSESCNRVEAYKPGATVGRDQQPVSKCGDLTAWKLGKRETLKVIINPHPLCRLHKRVAAAMVARLLGWV
jgi:hypothetical protein